MSEKIKSGLLVQKGIINLNRLLLDNLDKTFKVLRSKGITQKEILTAAKIEKSYFYRNRNDLRPSETAAIIEAANKLLNERQRAEAAATA